MKTSYTKNYRRRDVSVFVLLRVNPENALQQSDIKTKFVMRVNTDHNYEYDSNYYMYVSLHDCFIVIFIIDFP
jgi:hypothetical protein